MVLRPAVLILASLLTLAAQDVRKLTILHSNDLHANLSPNDRRQGGFAYLATEVRRQREGCGHCLYLDAGDLVQGTPVSTLFKGMPVFEIANRLGFDAYVLGNHDFDYGHEQVPRFIRKAKFPVIAANVVNGRGESIATPYIIRKVNGIRVGIIGLVPPDLVRGLITPRLAGPWKALPLNETVRRYMAELEGKADFIVVLAHISTADGSALLRDVPEVDVVVQGHSHRGRSEMERIEDRVAVGGLALGVEVNRLDLEVRMPEGKITTAAWTRIPIDATKLSPAPDVAKQIAKWEKKVEEIVRVPIGTAEREFPGADLVPMIEQAMRDEMHADFAFMNRGGVRAPLPKGLIQARHIWNIMPFDNHMVTAKVKGSQLSEAIRHGRPVEPNREYTLALFDFLVQNQKEREALGLDGIEFTDHDLLLRDLLINWFKKQAVLK